MANTTNYGWAVPTVGASADVWGGIINTTLQAVDTQVYTNAQSPSATFKGRVSGTGVTQDVTTTQATAMLNAFGGATQSTGGLKGLVPATLATYQDRVLAGDGSWRANVAPFASAKLIRSGNGVTGGYNIASGTWTGGGPYAVDVVFTNAAPNANYRVQVTAVNASLISSVAASNVSVLSGSITTAGFQIVSNSAETAYFVQVTLA